MGVTRTVGSQEELRRLILEERRTRAVEEKGLLFVGTGVGVWKSTNRGGRWMKAGFNETPGTSVPARSLAWQGDRLFAGAVSRGGVCL